MKQFLFGCLLFLTACQAAKTTQTSPLSNEILYENAIREAMTPSKSKISSNLVAIHKKNKSLTWNKSKDSILVVAWKRDSHHFPQGSMYNTREWAIWVTTAPELKQRMKSEKDIANVSLRLKQLLGLPPDGEYKYFIEFWVKPSDLFRPCPDKEIDDCQCDLDFPNETEDEHIHWIDSIKLISYSSNKLYEKYPWTKLGYTYDWNAKNTSHIGLSEFVIPKNTNIVVSAIYTTEEYLAK